MSDQGEIVQRLQPLSLFKCCLVHIVRKSLTVLNVNLRPSLKDPDGQSVMMALPRLPITIYDKVVYEIVWAYVMLLRVKSGVDRTLLILASMDKFLSYVLTDRVSELNLSKLAYLSNLGDPEMMMFRKGIFGRVNLLSNLVTLSLRTNAKDITLPVCDDGLLEEIGTTCKKLTSLDVSYNTKVTINGLTYLLPSASSPGCPLQKLFIFECSVSSDDVARLLLNMRSLEYLGFRETGTSLLKIYLMKLNIVLSLVHINNLGLADSTHLDYHKLHYSQKMSCIVFNMCPRLKDLRVRVTDQTLQHAILGPNVTALNLVFNIKKPLPVGTGALSFLNKYGNQIVKLDITCGTVNKSHLLQIGNSCKNLAMFNIKCTEFLIDCNTTYKQVEETSFKNLEHFCFKVTNLAEDKSRFAIECLPALLINSTLKHFSVVVKSSLIKDSWLLDLMLKVNFKMLEHFEVDSPEELIDEGFLGLTMSSVELLLANCPHLKHFGNLQAWDISSLEVNLLSRNAAIKPTGLTGFYSIIKTIDFFSDDQKYVFYHDLW